MSDDKTFDSRVIGSITTGTMLLEQGFSNVHEALEHVLGHPVWTHEMRSKSVWEAARAAVIEWYPEFPIEPPADYQLLARRLLCDYPDGVILPRGSQVRTSGPLESLREIAGDRPIAVVTMPADGDAADG